MILIVSLLDSWSSSLISKSFFVTYAWQFVTVWVSICGVLFYFIDTSNNTAKRAYIRQIGNVTGTNDLWRKCTFNENETESRTLATHAFVAETAANCFHTIVSVRNRLERDIPTFSFLSDPRHSLWRCCTFHDRSVCEYVYNPQSPETLISAFPSRNIRH